MSEKSPTRPRLTRRGRVPARCSERTEMTIDDLVEASGLLDGPPRREDVTFHLTLSRATLDHLLRETAAEFGRWAWVWLPLRTGPPEEAAEPFRDDQGEVGIIMLSDKVPFGKCYRIDVEGLGAIVAPSPDREENK